MMMLRNLSPQRLVDQEDPQDFGQEFLSQLFVRQGASVVNEIVLALPILIILLNDPSSSSTIWMTLLCIRSRKLRFQTSTTTRVRQRREGIGPRWSKTI